MVTTAVKGHCSGWCSSWALPVLIEISGGVCGKGNGDILATWESGEPRKALGTKRNTLDHEP